MTRFRLDDLGWWEFERLCQALLQSAYGVVIAAWGGTADGGRDAYTEDSLNFPRKDEEQAGPFVFQAKFVQGANAAGARPAPALKGAVSAEVKRIEPRAAAGEWDAPRCYVLMTNAPLSATLRKDLTETLQEGLPQSRIVLCGEAEISNMLLEAKTIRTSFPQLLGIQDLEDLLARASGRDAAVRGDLVMEEAAALAPVFAPTRAYSQAITTLTSHGFVVLTGPPEMGKTSIALMIGLARLGDGWDVFDCVDPEDFFKAHNRERSQVFLADDAFGSTEYSPDRGKAWGRDLHKILRGVDYRHWLIWTSRPAPLKLGLRQVQLQGEAEKFPEPGEIQVDASGLNQQEKALILYKHCKHAELDPRTKEVVRRNARFIVSNSDFTPERIRRLTTERLSEITAEESDDAAIREAIAAELEQSTDRMAKSFGNLEAEHKRLLVAMLDANPGLVSIEGLKAAYERHRPPEGDTPVSDLIDDLAHHFLRPA